MGAILKRRSLLSRAVYSLSLFIHFLYVLSLVPSLSRSLPLPLPLRRTRGLLKRRGTWHSATGMEFTLMARALGPSEKRNIVLALPSRNSACASSIFALSRARSLPLNDPPVLFVTLCLIIIAPQCLFCATSPTGPARFPFGLPLYACFSVSVALAYAHAALIPCPELRAIA